MTSQANETLGGLTESLGLDPAPPDHDPLVGRDVGGVTLMRLIAEGGMGRVYEGLQAKPRRAVAVKVMRPGFVSKEICRRFDHEAEVLGRLQHSAIAQIYSGGVCTIAGAQVPYMVMEYVPYALPITVFAAQHSLTTAARLELFHKVCEAVAHGHQKGVVHRDLKPSNILVDPSGQPKVIDFGVSRTIDHPAESVTALTDVGQLIGTVQYMSPEQFAADPSQIDTRTDVYALGVIFYELLTGQPPYEIRRKQIFEAAEVVRRKKPVSPSQLNRDIGPDVEKIAGTCLQKERAKRYANAAEVADDLAVCLRGGGVRRPQLPVAQNRRHSQAAWATNRWPLAGVVGVLIALVAVLIFNAFVSSPPRANKMTNSLGMALVRAPRGEFTVEDGKVGALPEGSHPRRHVRITQPFWMGQYEVTQAQWKSLMGTSPWLDKRAVVLASDAPAVCVSWSDAVSFCQFLTARERASGTLGKDEEYRLPTEAEWEYACRAGSSSAYGFGDDVALLGDHAWYQHNSADIGRPYARPVGTRQPNAWGLHDMHGNVWEWVLDAYGPNPPHGDDPLCLDHTERRVLRGGSWFAPPGELQASYRHSSPNENADNRFRNMGDLGFRVVMGKVVQPPPHIPRPEAPTRLLALRGSHESTFELDVVGHDMCPVWGSNPYTDDSCLATAAVHAGALKAGERGTITVSLLSGLPAYEASMANGIQTRPYGAWSHAFRIEAAAGNRPIPGDRASAADPDRLTTLFDKPLKRLLPGP
jgi:formylglycine-generating enzyme required for sulfatase activity